ncbi:MAG: ABC transporter permease [Christensenellaceae bacterium]|jgi:ABC-2 type transport system permease protein
MRLYFKYFAIQLKSEMEHKLSFWLTTIGQFITAFSAVLGIYFLLSRFHAIEGFSFSEVLLCYAIVLVGFTLAECFARGFDTFFVMLGNGEFDRILVRPRGEIFQVFASKIEFGRIGRLLQAFAVLLYAIPASGAHWSLSNIFLLITMLLGGFTVFMGLFILYATLCFFTTEGLEFMNIFTYGSKEFGQYPVSVCGKEILAVFTYIVPIALFQYYPLLYLLGKSENLLYFFLPMLTPLFLIPCLALWKLGVRKYHSTGS